MKKAAFAVPLLILAACAAPPKPDPSPSDPKECAALEAKRQQLVAKFNSLPQSAAAEIDKTSKEIEAVGKLQVEKGCAG